MHITENPVDALLCAKHHGLKGWKVEEVWYADIYKEPLPPGEREYYWESGDAVSRVKELKNSGRTEQFIVERTFVLTSPQDFGRKGHIFLVEKSSLVEVQKRFEQTLPPAPRWKCTNVYDYDKEVLGRPTSDEVWLASALMAVTAIIPGTVLSIAGAQALDVHPLAKLFVALMGVSLSACVPLVLGKIPYARNKLLQYGRWLTGLPMPRNQ